MGIADRRPAAEGFWMTRTRLKALAKRPLLAVGRLRRPRAGRVVVLCYHSIHPSNSFRSATPDLFDQHLAWIADTCEVVPFTEAQPSPDGSYVRCHRPDGSRRCFFAPRPNS